MNVCPQHDEGSGPCNCNYERTADRAARNAAKRVAEGGLAKARAALRPVDKPPKIPRGHTGPLARAQQVTQ